VAGQVGGDWFERSCSPGPGDCARALGSTALAGQQGRAVRLQHQNPPDTKHAPSSMGSECEWKRGLQPLSCQSPPAHPSKTGAATRPHGLDLHRPSHGSAHGTSLGPPCSPLYTDMITRMPLEWGMALHPDKERQWAGPPRGRPLKRWADRGLPSPRSVSRFSKNDASPDRAASHGRDTSSDG
jgi:hypothetical protein